MNYNLLLSERYILQLIYEDHSFLEIAGKLNITMQDLNIMLDSIRGKLHIDTFCQLAAFAWHLAETEQQSTLLPEITQETMFTKEEMKDLEYLKTMWEKKGIEQH